MTLLLGVPPLVARDFSFGIQSFGMTCASITIFGLNVPLDHEALLWASIGGVLGLVTGLGLIAPYLPPAYSKLLFVSVWMTFAVALFKLNARGRDRRVYQSALESDQAVNASLKAKGSENSCEDSTSAESASRETRLEIDHNISLTEVERKQKRSRAWALFSIGCFGGVCSSVAGSGLDIATFSLLTLYYRESEKVATPTSVVLMAANALIGVFCRIVIGLGGAYKPGQLETIWNFVSVCIPIVVIGAPLGATISSWLGRDWLAWMIYFLDSVQFVPSLAVIQPWTEPYPQKIGLCVTSATTLLLGSFVFFKIASWGEARGDCEFPSNIHSSSYGENAACSGHAAGEIVTTSPDEDSHV
jgi:uncharacterized membrane protein YfcA